MCVCVCGGGGVSELGLLREYNQVFFSFFLSRAGVFRMLTKVLFTALCAHLSVFFVLFFHSTGIFLNLFFWGGGGGSELFRPKYENKGEITQSRVYNFFYRNLLQEYVHFFNGCKSFANKTG